MDNPCKECIVDAICKEVCENLTIYLKKSLSKEGFTESSYGTIGQWLRNGTALLVNGDSDYRHIIEEDRQ